MSEETDNQNIEQVAERVEQRIQEYALIPKEDRDMSLSIYKQACLFEELHLPKHYMFTSRIILSDDKKSYQLVKREKPLEPIDFVLEDRHDVGGKVVTFAERSGFDASFKHHDHDHLLFDALNCTIEAKELM